ncbi:GNAT family N-acetyltransferase [Nocardia sp. NPDC005978]|uniref:GNAT family N-acetyltransferase n=1 Tax=unclassified Nocardia TaxID=2637762 RepID=UPI0033AE08AD
MNEWRVVPLGPEHVDSLAECHIACWREAYRELVPAHVLAAFDVRRGAARWERTRAAGILRIMVAVHTDPVHGDTVIGFASTGPARDESPVAAHELSAMYVRARWYGTGVSHDLMRAVLAEDADTYLWVFEENPRALAFYRTCGFRLDGERRVEAFTPAIEVRMVRRASR